MAESITEDRSKWFLDRIGKTVYRGPNGCPCRVCDRVEEEGIYISDEMHADYMDMCEHESIDSPFPYRYFDTKEEVEAYKNKITNATN